MNEVKDKYKLDVLMEEYRILSKEILKRVEFQQRLLNYELFTAGAILSIIIQILLSSNLEDKVGEAIKFFYVLAPYVFLFFAWTFARHDVMILGVASYKENVIKPLVREITGSNSVLSYEEYLSKIRISRRKRYGLLVKIEQGSVLPILMNLVITAVYIISYSEQEYKQFAKGDLLVGLRLLLVTTNIILFIRTTFLGFVIPSKYINLPSATINYKNNPADDIRP